MVEKNKTAKDFDAHAWVKADKGYKSAENDAHLKKRKLMNLVMYKAQNNRILTASEIQCNKLISKIRYSVERSFGSMNRWFGAGMARYVVLAKTHSRHLIEAIAHNLYRSPGIVISKCKNKRQYAHIVQKTKEMKNKLR